MNGNPRLVTLDAIRGLAAISVLLLHPGDGRVVGVRGVVFRQLGRRLERGYLRQRVRACRLGLRGRIAAAPRHAGPLEGSGHLLDPAGHSCRAHAPRPELRYADGADQWLGAISYPLYAIHLPLLLMIASRFDVARAWMLVAAAIIAIATAVEYAYDAPLRKRLLGYAAAPRPM